MEYTDILALKKPGDSDNALIGDINDNMDALEDAVYKRRAICSSAASTQTKTATCAGFVLAEGVIVAVEFANKNTKAGFTLNINGTGAKAVYFAGTPVTDKVVPLQALLYYDGTRYNLLNPDADALTPEQIGAAAASHASQHASGGSDPITPADIGAAKRLEGTGTLPITGWTDATASLGYFHTTLSLSGIEASDEPHVGIVKSFTDSDADDAMQEAWNTVEGAEAVAGGIKFYAKEAPAVACSFQWEVVR